MKINGLSVNVKDSCALFIIDKTGFDLAASWLNHVLLLLKKPRPKKLTILGLFSFIVLLFISCKNKLSHTLKRHLRSSFQSRNTKLTQPFHVIPQTCSFGAREIVLKASKSNLILLAYKSFEFSTSSFKPSLNIFERNVSHSFHFLHPAVSKSRARFWEPTITVLSCCTCTHYAPIFIAVLQGRGSPYACWLVLSGWPVLEQR